MTLSSSPAGFAFLGVAVVFDTYIPVVVSSQSVAIFSITKYLSVPRGLDVPLVLSQACFPCSPVPLGLEPLFLLGPWPLL